VNLFNYLSNVCCYLNRYQLIKESCYSISQFYEWLKNGIRERKPRECKLVSTEVVKAAVEVIGKYPHFSAPKGQCYMIYHQLGYIPHHLYKSIKKIVKRLIFQEVSSRQLLPARTSYTHERPQHPGEIWAEDFTEIRVCGEKFYIALVIDVKMTYYLGATASIRANAQMVEIPVMQAMEANNNQGPKRFLLSDNGSQYVDDKHGKLLDKLDIVQKRIPSCAPEYNGSVECGIKEFKNVFYNVWAQRENSRAEKGKGLLKHVNLAVAETVLKMNEDIPRPGLNGVTAADVMEGIEKEKMEINRTYLAKEHEKKEVSKPWNRKDWEIIKEQLFKTTVSNLELMTKFCFFLKRPLRKLVGLGREVWGN
jgi:transposase InsO family protein